MSSRVRHPWAIHFDATDAPRRPSHRSDFLFGEPNAHPELGGDHHLALSVGATRVDDLVAVVEPNGGVRVWDVKANKEVGNVSPERAGTLTGCAFAPDGKTLAAPGRDGVIYRWEVAGWKKLPSCAGHKGPVSAVAFAPDGRRLVTAAGSDETIKLWRVADGTEFRSMSDLLATPGNRQSPQNVTFSPDGQLLAAAAGFRSIRRFNELFQQMFGKPPNTIRRAGVTDQSVADGGAVSVRLGYRPPYDRPAMVSFLKARAIAGVETVTDAWYARTRLVCPHRRARCGPRFHHR